jgi:hypothetical protein
MLKFIRWVLRLFGVTPRYTVTICDDLPDDPAEKQIYLVGEKDHYWQAALKCPCGCGDLIQLPLTQETSPRWRIDGTQQHPTLAPSINRTTRCRSHFFLRSGTISWCK